MSSFLLSRGCVFENRGQTKQGEINLEAKALQFCLTHAALSGIVALDQAAAFPILSRKYLFWVLKKMKVPKPIRRLIRFLYTGGRSGISINGRIYAYFISESGVKQGCPAAIILFVLAFGPVLRFIASRLRPMGDSLFGYCDDLAIAAVSSNTACKLKQ